MRGPLGTPDPDMQPSRGHVEALMRCLEPLHDAFRPVLGIKEGSGGRQLKGTATLIQEGEQRFLVTAHHVVKDGTPKSFGVSGSESIPWPKNYFILRPGDQSLPDPDIAWAHTRSAPPGAGLDGGIGAALAVTAHEESGNTAYLAAGYPASKGKVRMGAGTAESKLMVALVELANREEWPREGLDSRTHVCFRYSQEGRTDIHGAPAVGAHPRGMSGGAVFAVGQPKQPTEKPFYVPFLVAVLTEFHEAAGILVGAKIGNLWEAVGMQTPRARQLYRAVRA